MDNDVVDFRGAPQDGGMLPHVFIAFPVSGKLTGP